MNIAIFTDGYLPTKNGVVSCILMEKKELEKQGHTVYIITVGPKDDIDHNVLRIRSLPLAFVKTKQPYYLGFARISKIEEFIKDKKIDIIHTHTEFFVGWLGSWISKRQKIPHVHTFHTMWEQYKKVYMITKYLVPPKIDRIYLKRFLRKPDLLIAPSQKGINYLIQLKLKQPMKLVPNSIYFNHNLDNIITRKNLRIKNNDLVLIFTGRISDEKRVLSLFKITKNIIKQDNTIKMIFVGDGSRLNEIKELVVQNNLSDNYIFTGFVNLEKVREYLSLSDIFITPSLTEVHSISALEAINSNLAMITRQDDSFEDQVIDGKNGFQCAEDLDMVDSVLFLRNEPKVLAKFKAKSLEISKSFTPKNHINKLLKAYKESVKTFS